MSENRMGMILFILSESVFFVLLTLTYVFYHQHGNVGAEAAENLDVVTTGIFSVFLFSSSATFWRAGVQLRRGRYGAAGAWLATTILLGAVFLAGQAREYLALVTHHITISRDLFGTTFFTLTGFHGIHVLTGLIMLTILLGFIIKGRAKKPSPDTFETIGLYWHFVDGVWVAIFSVVYLWTLV